MGSNSQTNALIDTFLAERQTRGFDDEVVVRDLAALTLPVLVHEVFHALWGGENLSKGAKGVVALSDELVAELKASDVLLIGAPMYNLNVPTQLKNWFDLVARARVTFRYTETHPMGLIEGVSAALIEASSNLRATQK